MNSKELCLELINSESEKAVSRIINNREILQDDSNWQNYGEVPNNFGIISNQQSDAVGALVEKLVNSIDACLTRECLLQGYNPKSSNAPQSMFEASEQFFDIPDGDLPKIIDQKRKRELAKNIFLVASGAKGNDPKNPCFSIVDQGEGQHPKDFSDTFLSLNQDNKNEIPFVQGRFNMGGTGVLLFRGQKNYQLIVSRRHPQLLEGQSQNPWGYTLVRKREPQGNEKSPVYEYFAPNGAIPKFESESLPLKPDPSEKGNPRSEPLESGTYIKLYDYDITHQTMVTADLYRRLNLRLFYLPLPITLYEGRNYKGHTLSSILEGMRARMESREFRGEVLEKPDFPIDQQVQVSDGNHVNVKVWLLKSDVEFKRWVPRTGEAICFTINGQTHAFWSRRFFGRNAVKKDYLKKHLVVEINCTNLSNKIINEMFMGSRDRMRNMEESETLEKELENWIKSDDILKKHNQIRREQQISEKLEESQETEEILKDFINASPEIAKLLGDQGNLPDPFKMGPQEKEAYEGNRFPTYMELLRPKENEMEVPNNSYRRVILETDVENEYLSRVNEPGELIIESEDWYKNCSLRNGRITIEVQPPHYAEVNDSVDLDIILTTPEVPKNLRETIAVTVGDEHERQSNPRGKTKERTSDLNIPPIHEVTQDEWSEYGWDKESVALVRTHDEGADVFVNIDNIHLQRALRTRNTRGDEGALKHLFKVGIGVISFALENKWDGEVPNQIKQSTYETIAMAWLPSVLNLSDLVEL